MKCIDLFSGIGGSSTGAEMAGNRVIWAANHWPEAVQWHSENHPKTQHACQDLHQADWRTVPAHDCLLASPCCQGHSKARGKNTPYYDASRSTAWAVVSAIEYHRPDVAIVENVQEFTDWKLFKPWRMCLESMGYQVAPHILDAANHGVAQHRVRMFLVCTKSESPLMLSFKKQPQKTAADVIDLNSKRWSQINKPSRSKKTLERIQRGRKEFGDVFVMPYYGSGSGLTGRDINRPLGTITTRDRWAVVRDDEMRMLNSDELRKAMGFPESTKLPNRHRLAVHLLGNAVCPPVVRDLLDEIQRVA